LTNKIESGISGYDNLTASNELSGGIPDHTTTLIYGPPKTGKTIFCNQFTYHGLQNGEPCLYITTDHGIRQLQNNMMGFEWYIQNYIQNENLYIIDGISQLGGAKAQDTNNIKTSTIGNPADMMVKVGIGSRFVFRKSSHFRSVLDSVNTMFAFNQHQMVIRVLNAYIRRISEAGGAGIMAYTEGVTDPATEEELISLFDNTIRLDGEYITVTSQLENDNSLNKFKSTYNITDKGIVVHEKI
jgi:KaiC/GvpD/RAD55 family RecA-like ATPase